MKLRSMLTAYRVFVALFQIAIVVLMFLGVYFIGTQQIRVEEVGTPDITFDGTNIILKVPVKIVNGGVYDINDITLSYRLSNASSQFTESQEYLGSVEGGDDAVIPLPVEINLTEIYKMEAPNFYHFFHRDTFEANFTLSLKYLLNMVSARMNYSTAITWKPPIKGYSLGDEYTFFMNSSGLHLKIPFYLNTESYMWGEACVSGDILSGEERIGEMNATAPLGEPYHGVLYLHLWKWKELITHTEILTMSGNFTVLNFAFPLRMDYRWGAPLSNLTYWVGGDGKIHYTFTDESPHPLHLYVNVTYYNGNVIVDTENERLSVQPGEHVSGQAKIPSESFDRVVISFYDSVTHLSYEEVVHL